MAADADTAGYPEIAHLANVALLAAEEAAERELIARREKPVSALEAATANAQLASGAEARPAI